MSHALALDFEDFANLTVLAEGRAVSARKDFQATPVAAPKAAAANTPGIKLNFDMK